MPAPARTLAAADVYDYVRGSIFTSAVEGRVGVEMEWLPVYVDDPATYVPLTKLAAILEPSNPLPSGGVVSFEPGGQVEISSLPGQSAAVTCTATASDLDLIRTKLQPHGIQLVGVGVDPYRTGCRFLRKPRYDAMEAYFGTVWPEGRVMMKSSCSLHINLDVTSINEGAERWRMVHALGPALIAAFANSAILDGTPSGWRSTRMALWQSLDRSRTEATPPVGDPVSVWSRYAMNANVMFVTLEDGSCQPLFEPFPFADWMERGHPFGYPTFDDLRIHLSTLFPPVRPKGWLELRMIDALPDPWWRVPVALTSAIVYDARAVAEVEDAVLPTADLWEVAARHGMSHPLLAQAARTCFEAGLEAMGRVDVDPESAHLVGAYYQRYVLNGRSPADDQLDAWRRGANLLTPYANLEEMWT